jgi:hypothetical protein
MACSLTANRTLDCRDALGGIVTVAFLEWETGAGYTIDGSGNLSALTVPSSAQTLPKYNLPQNNGAFSSAPTGSRENGTIFFTDTLSIVLHKFQDQDHEEIFALAKGRWIVFVEDRNSNILISGIERGMEVTGGTVFSTGTAIGDMSGHTIELSCESSIPPLKVAVSGASADFDTDIEALNANITVGF